MILIIEGMDSCGKSTLVQNLRRYVLTTPKTIVHHSSSPPKNIQNPNGWEYEHYLHLSKTFRTLSDNQGYDIICDRFHIGSMVYGTKYRGLVPHGIFLIDKDHLASKDVHLVLLVDDPAKVIERHDGLSIEKTETEFSETRNSFEYYFNYSRIPNKILIDVSDNGGYENTIHTVSNWLKGS